MLLIANDLHCFERDASQGEAPRLVAKCNATRCCGGEDCLNRQVTLWP